MKHTTLILNKAYFLLWAGFIAPALAGCAPKPPVAPPKSPEIVLPPSGTCPGAVPLQNIQVTMSMGESNDPSMVWDGKMFRIAWWDMRSTEPEIYTVGLDAEGFETAPARKIVSQGWSTHPVVSYDGKETHLVWSEEPGIFSARLGEGNPEVATLSTQGAEPDAGAWGGAVWVSEGLLYFRSDGMIPSSEGGARAPKIIANGGIESPKLAYTGFYYAVVWSESVVGGRSIMMQRVSPQGETLGNRVVVSKTKGIHKSPGVRWTGNGFVVLWTEAVNIATSANRNQIHLALVPEVGDAPIVSQSTQLFSNAESVAVASAGKEYAAAWSEETPDRTCGIYFQRFSVEGDPIGQKVAVTDATPPTCSRPSLTWNGSGYAATWHDDRGGRESEIYFSHLSCGDEEIPEPPAPKPSPPSGPSDVPALKNAF